MIRRVEAGKSVPLPLAVRKRTTVRREFLAGAGVYELARRYGTAIPIIEAILRGRDLVRRPHGRPWEE